MFISYSHKDEVWKDRLVTHLAVLAKQGLLDSWDDRRIAAGESWREEICNALDGAGVGILLVSASFLSSDFILREEVSRLLERRTAGGLDLVPVIVRSCTWTRVPWLSPLQARPRDGRALADFRGDQRDRELAKIADEVLRLLDSGPQKQARPGVTPASPESRLPPGQPAPEEQQPPATPQSQQALHQLKAPPADFTGRAAELAMLRAAVAAGGATISGVHGSGGIGKTALALRLAEELAPRYPDAQVFLDLKGVGEPLTPAEALAFVIRAFEPTAALPEDEQALGGLYRSLLHDRRALLVMDNAAGPAQVEPLIPPPGCLLLVTSRAHFTLPGLVAVDLHEMPEPDARDLLLRIAPRAGEAAGEIARLCGRLPIALRLAAGALAERPWLTPGDYARRLGDAKEQLGLIEGTLTTSYDLLAEEARALWRRLAVFPGTFDLPAAAAVWERQPPAAEPVLAELVRASMVEWEEEAGEGAPAQAGRFRLHDLARVFAAARLGVEEREAARRRHAEHYVQVLAAADDLYLQGGEPLLRGLRLFDRERGNVQAGQAWAAARAGEDESAAGLSSAYPDAGVYCLALRQHPRERAGWLEAALAGARRTNDRAAEGCHLGNLGLAYRNLGEPQRAIEYHEQALVISREIGNRRAEGQDLGSLGLAYAVLGEPQRAIGHYERWLAITREIGDRREEGNALGNLGNAYAALGEPRRAIEHHEQALVISREIGERHAEGQDLGNLGLAYAALGEPQLAIEHYEQHLTITREISDRRGEASACWNLGLTLERQGDLARAVDLMQVCVDYERAIGHPNAEERAAQVASLRDRTTGGSAAQGR